MGYAKLHSAGTFRLYNPATRKVILSRDVTFLGEISDNVEIEENDEIIQLTPTSDLALRDGVNERIIATTSTLIYLI